LVTEFQHLPGLPSSSSAVVFRGGPSLSKSLRCPLLADLPTAYRVKPSSPVATTFNPNRINAAVQGRALACIPSRNVLQDKKKLIGSMVAVT
jgi:hypothetical protein